MAEYATDPAGHAVSLLQVAARAMRSPTTPPADEVRAIHAAVNALQARESDLLAEMDATKAHESEGAPSVAAWAARELVQAAKVTRQSVRAARTMRELPAFGDAARAGRLSAQHMNAMTYALKHVGSGETRANEAELLAVASNTSPRDLFGFLRTCKAIVHSDELDEKWLAGMDKADVQCLPVGDGYQVGGFLPIDVGAKLSAFLKAIAVPRGADDARSSAQRRVDGLDELLARALGVGLPATGGGRPQLSVVVDAEALKDAINAKSSRSARDELLHREPAILEGFGPIGPALLAYIAYGGDLTPILVAGFKENRKVLDVGRTQRLATLKQRRIIAWRQKGRCANHGCYHPIGEIHHIVEWHFGGRTDLDNLAGLCRKCHALITVGRLRMTGGWSTGYAFTSARGSPLARTG
jgi:hypothetical protein